MKLAVISHTEHYKNHDGTIVGWGPTISELNHLAEDFDEIYHIAFLHPGEPPPSSLPYTSSKIKFVPLSPVGGKSIGAKLQVLFHIPKILDTVRKTLKQVDAFQLRTPTGMGVFLIPYLTFFCAKKGWYKYAGNWSQEKPPLGYALQRWMLKKQKRKVTINGSWPAQPAHCLTFENPCLTVAQRDKGREILKNKEFFPNFSFCFVGRLDDDKGVQHIIDAFGKLEKMATVEKIHFVGNGPKLNYYKNECKRLNIPAVFLGFLARDEVFEIYKECDFMLLPSKSEGFPKVIAEAMNFGCIPVVSNISCIGQYVNRENGYTFYPITSDRLKEIIKEAIAQNGDALKNKAINCHAVTANFTFEHYRRRIQKEIVNQSI